MDALDISSALAVTGLKRSVWNLALQRGHFTEPPRTTQGVPRRFQRDDLVTMTILKVLLDLRMQVAFAGDIASQIRIKLRQRENIVALYLTIVTDKDGKHRPVVVDSLPDDGQAPFVFSIATYRRQAERDIARALVEGGRIWTVSRARGKTPPGSR